MEAAHSDPNRWLRAIVYDLTLDGRSRGGQSWWKTTNKHERPGLGQRCHSLRFPQMTASQPKPDGHSVRKHGLSYTVMADFGMSASKQERRDNCHPNVW